jgi:hypothetical protein
MTPDLVDFLERLVIRLDRKAMTHLELDWWIEELKRTPPQKGFVEPTLCQNGPTCDQPACPEHNDFEGLTPAENREGNAQPLATRPEARRG